MEADREYYSASDVSRIICENRHLKLPSNSSEIYDAVTDYEDKFFLSNYSRVNDVGVMEFHRFLFPEAVWRYLYPKCEHPSGLGDFNQSGQSKTCTVRYDRDAVRVDGREYRHASLEAYRGAKVVVRTGVPPFGFAAVLKPDKRRKPCTALICIAERCWPTH